MFIFSYSATTFGILMASPSISAPTHSLHMLFPKAYNIRTILFIVISLTTDNYVKDNKSSYHPNIDIPYRLKQQSKPSAAKKRKKYNLLSASTLVALPVSTTSITPHDIHVHTHQPYKSTNNVTSMT